MRYEDITQVYEKLESTTSRIEKTVIIRELIKKTPSNLLPKVILLSMGRVFAPWEEKNLGIAAKLIIRAISRSTGNPVNKIEEWWKETGDLGETASIAVKNKKQVSLFFEPLTVEKVFNTLRKIAEIEGEGSIDKKILLVSELISNSTPKEAKYIVRTILEELRIGVGEGIIRDAISEAFGVSPDTLEEYYNLTNDYGIIAKILSEKGKEGLKEIKLEIGKPIRVMLAQKVETIEEGFEVCGKPAALEYKYDGFRMQIHKKGNKIWLFTRRLEDVTERFPDVVEAMLSAIKAEECIVEGETIGIDPQTKKWLPFQKISRRIQRKYNIEEMAKKIPVMTNLFDIVYLNGELLINKPFKERRKLLESIINQIPNKVQLATQLVTDNTKEGENFYKKSLEMGNEGIMIKNLNAPYKPGKRVGYMVKLKPIMDTLDLVIVGAEWGEGRRANWLSSFLLACRDPQTGRFLTVGKLGTGLTDSQFQEMTEMLKPLIIEEKGKEVVIKPWVVVEVAYEEIQKSPKYDSGFALRFPRLVQVRPDRSPEDIDTIEKVIKLYEQQFRQ